MRNSAKKILITGAKGMLGQDLCPTLQDSGFEVIETDIDNLDITDFKKAQEFIKNKKPDIIINCAAYTDVDKAEKEVEKANLVNVKGSENIAKACAEITATMIYISTDYVFDGCKKGAYLVDDIPNPINVYGKTKLGGELAVQKYCNKYYIVRTSWLYGIHGKNFVETMIALANKPELKVVDDQIGCPTWTIDLSDGIVELLKNNFNYGIYHICNSGKTSWYGFAKEIFKLAGLDVKLMPCNTQSIPRPAKRPKNSVMENNKILRNWKPALRNYIALREI